MRHPKLGREARMQPLPLYPSLESTRLAVEECTACPRSETRQMAVFGIGNRGANLMLVGEAPSSTDDDTGKPFTGPAGRLLDRVLADIGISRDEIWITNLTRCFAGRERNNRIENRPATVREIRACSSWMDIELQYVNPKVIVAVGAPAARSLIAADFRLQDQRGEFFERPDGRLAIATYQPAYVMRLTSIVDKAASDTARDQLTSDLRMAAEAAGLGGDHS